MPEPLEARGRIVPAVHAVEKIGPDPDYELGMSRYLRAQYAPTELLDLYARYTIGESAFDALMRRIIWRAVAQQFGNGIHIGSGVGFKHLETFQIGHGVFIGAQAYIQGRFDGTCVIGNHVWIGPQSYLDARDLVMEDHVGWGPGAKLLGSTHTGIPIDVPIVQTDLQIAPVRIEAWADIGTNAVILPGVTVGRGSMVGAGAVVTKDVSPFAVVAGVPARFLRWREGFDPESADGNQES